MFGNDLVTTQIDRELWRVERPLYFDFKGYHFIAPECLVYDGTSAPRGTWWAVGHPLEGANGISGAFHDPAYGLSIIPQKICDEMYLEVQRLLGTPYFSRITKFNMLRAVGHISYNKSQGCINIDPQRLLKGYGNG